MRMQMGFRVTQNCCVQFLHSVPQARNIPGNQQQPLPELCQHFRSTGHEVLTKRVQKAAPSQFILQSNRTGGKPRVRLGEDMRPEQRGKDTSIEVHLSESNNQNTEDYPAGLGLSGSASKYLS